jgi:hypothetical protein
LKEYETMAVEIEGADADAAQANSASAAQDWLEDEEDSAPAAH